MSAIIGHVKDNSIAQNAGLLKGDMLVEINRNQVRDVIDYMFYGKDDNLDLKIKRGGKPARVRIKKKERTDIGIELKPFRIRRCNNKCIFCFVNQLPRGLRKSLYVKDDDYRMSFLYGNYITLTNLTPSDKKRIFLQKLRPLYVSVHSTNDDLRRKMLGNAKAPEILKQIRELALQKINIHTQIVICPGMNDGEELDRTVRDLQKFYPFVSSIAVVPAGLTKHRRSGVKPVEKKDALRLIDQVAGIRKRFRRRHGDPIVYLSDEIYIKAGVPFPSLKDYGDLPQLENGVGMVPLFLQNAKKLKLPKSVEPRKVATFSGSAFLPFLKEFAERLKSISGLTMEVFPVENRLFGPSVTVTGLLSGKDVLKTLVGKTQADCLLVPSVALRNGEDDFLDNVTLKDMQESLGMHILPIEASPAGLLKGVRHECKRKN